MGYFQDTGVLVAVLYDCIILDKCRQKVYICTALCACPFEEEFSGTG